MAAAPQQPSSSDSTMGILWVIAAIFIVVGLVWYYTRDYLIAGYLKMKLFELDIIGLFTHRLDDVHTALMTANAHYFSFVDVVRVSNAVGNYAGIPCAAFVGFLAIVAFLSNPTRAYRRTYSMRSLMQAEQVNWPQISPFLKLDLVKTDIGKGSWAMAMTPMQFCKKYKLLDEFKRQPHESVSRKQWNRIEVTLRRGQATRMFILQLGPLWTGVDKLPMHVKALFAIFAARYNSDSQSALKLLRQLSASSTSKLNFSGVDALCRKHMNTKQIQKITQSHAYVLTVMASMLVAAREDGVQASADFLWLKPVDRRLWYMLNTVGRQTPFVEVAGPFAHWLAEKEIDRKLLVPMVEEATNALEKVLKEIIYKPDEEE